MRAIRGSAAVMALVFAMSGCGELTADPVAAPPSVAPSPSPAAAPLSRAEVVASLGRPVELDCRGNSRVDGIVDGAGEETSPRTAEARLRLYLRPSQRLDPDAERSQEASYIRLMPPVPSSATFVGLRSDGSVFAVVDTKRSSKGGWSISGFRHCSDTKAPSRPSTL
ncbi:MAG: hypothetical protein ACT4QF_14720 [Sporichthyaceae bacterium]